MLAPHRTALLYTVPRSAPSASPAITGEVVLPLDALLAHAGEERDEWFSLDAPPIASLLPVKSRPSNHAVQGQLRLRYKLEVTESAGASDTLAKRVAASATTAPLKEQPQSTPMLYHRVRQQGAGGKEFDQALHRHRARPLSERLFHGHRRISELKVPEELGGSTGASLWVRIVGAERLLVADSTGSSDPYCELYAWSPELPVCEHQWRTATKLKTLDPRWNEEVAMRLPSTRGFIHLCVFDWDNFGTDDFLGEALIDLRCAVGSSSRQVAWDEPEGRAAWGELASGAMMTRVALTLPRGPLHTRAPPLGAVRMRAASY